MVSFLSAAAGALVRSVPVPMVNIREMRVLVRHGLVSMPMAVRFLAIPSKVMRMLVVLVMSVRMRVLQRFVGVFMVMPFTQMQPDTQAHQGTGQPKQGRCGFAQKQHSHRRPHERRR